MDAFSDLVDQLAAVAEDADASQAQPVVEPDPAPGSPEGTADGKKGSRKGKPFDFTDPDDFKRMVTKRKDKFVKSLMKLSGSRTFSKVVNVSGEGTGGEFRVVNPLGDDDTFEDFVISAVDEALVELVAKGGKYPSFGQACKSLLVSAERNLVDIYRHEGSLKGIKTREKKQPPSPAQA